MVLSPVSGMDRDAVGYLVLGVLAILAISFAAVTLPSASEPGASGGGNETDTGLFPGPDRTEPAGASIDLPPIVVRLFEAVVLAALALTVVVVVRYPVATLQRMALVVAVFTLIVVLAYALPQLFGSLFGGSGGGLFGGEGSGVLDGDPLEEGRGSLPPVTSLLAVAVVVVVLLGATATRVRRTLERGEMPSVDTVDVAARVGAIAGRAADRIEAAGAGADAPVENEVYRAWREMARSLDVERPASSTPAEFARTAIEAGLDPGTVDELTDLFREVRYGDAAPTTDRERRAVAALRRIEDAHADGGGA